MFTEPEHGNRTRSNVETRNTTLFASETTVEEKKWNGEGRLCFHLSNPPPLFLHLLLFAFLTEGCSATAALGKKLVLLVFPNNPLPFFSLLASLSFFHISPFLCNSQKILAIALIQTITVYILYQFPAITRSDKEGKNA